MKITLSLLAALALVACTSEKEPTVQATESSTPSTMDAPKAQTVSLNISGMT